MIEKMSHYTFLVYHRDYTSFLTRLQELGVLHVSPTREGNLTENSEFQTSLLQVERFKKVLTQMSAILKKDEMESISQNREKYALDKPVTEVNLLCKNWEEICDQISQKEKIFKDLDNDIKLMTPWGDFEQMTLDHLSKAGWRVRFWSVTHKKYDSDWENQFNAFIINKDKKNTYFITINQLDKEVEMSYAIEHKLCPSPASTLIMLQTKTKDGLKKLKEEQGDFALQHYATIERIWKILCQKIDLKQVELTTAGEAEGRVMMLEGWVPTKQCKTINTLLNAEGIYFESRAANREDNAPILLRNNSFTKLYEVFVKMYGMPQYSEFDPTPIVAPFYMLFFGFCMGDAGYGVIMLLLAMLLKKKMGKSMAGMMNLVITLGIGTTIMGILFGSFFGANLFDFGFPEWFKPYVITGKIADTSYDKQMALALGIGIFHICLAMVVKAIGTTIRFGFKENISTWSWTLLIVGGVITASLGFLEILPQDITHWSFISIASISGIGIYLINNLKRNIFVNIGSGLWDTYNMASGLLGDVLSYVRLYALALAGGMLGATFNDLGMMARDGMGDENIILAILGWLVCGLIMIFGHTLNIAMSCLSAFVHPLRLTFVEYFKNSGFEGGGEEYKPLGAPIEE